VARRVTNQQLVEALRAIPLFASCTKRELTLLARISKVVEYAAGYTIVAQGEEGVGLHVLLEGNAKVEINGRTRRRLGPGDFFGEIALLDNGPRTATVVTESHANVLFIARWNFRELLADQPALALRMLEVVARRLRDSS
jgi:CRP/FNR family transcriptional regulator, cyclic AMP receptor protein